VQIEYLIVYKNKAIINELDKSSVLQNMHKDL